MTAFEMTDDADFVTDSFALTVDAGIEIDLEGYVLTLPGSFFENMKSANKQLLVNGGFESDSVDSGAYLEYKPTGWTRGGTVALISANNGDPSIIDTVIETYASEKSLKKAWYMAELKKRGFVV